MKILSLLIVSSLLFAAPASIDRLSASVTTRQLQQGKSVTIRGDVFYQRNGNMVTHFSFPKEVVILANKLGETRIYDPRRNEVVRAQNEAYSTQTTQLSFFLTGATSDMGLIRLGFVQDKTVSQGKRLVTEWRLKNADKKKPIQRVKIVYEQALPIYMHYADGAGRIVRKVFYYNYQPIEGRPFPNTTTEILYQDQDRDSTISKTTYGNFLLNGQATSPYFEYTIPANAKTHL
jgi:outer membrane lipoprotein-sorting protein